MQAVWRRFLDTNPAWRRVVTEVDAISEEDAPVDYSSIAEMLPLIDY